MQRRTDAAPWSAGILGYLRAFSFPFAVPGWPRKLWRLPLIAVIPLVGVVLMRGWRTAVVRRMGLGNPDPLPDLRDLTRFVKDGIWLWLMNAIYFVPQAILLFFFGVGAISMAITIGRWLIAQLSGEIIKTCSARLMPGCYILNVYQRSRTWLHQKAAAHRGA